MSFLSEAKIQYALDDISIIPAEISDISSRKECNPYVDSATLLPIFTAPMASVVSTANFSQWIEKGVMPILPRNEELNNRIDCTLSGGWAAYSLDEFKKYFIEEHIHCDPNETYETTKVLIDIANGHMQKLVDYIKEAKKVYKELNIELLIMCGNIANPKTFKILAEAGADYVRCGIGSGNCCITSSNVNVHYSMASLIADCADIKEANDLETKIIADGGISTYNRAITALALGADYVMIGSAFSKCYESAAPFIFYPNPKHPEYTNHSLDITPIAKELSNTNMSPFDYSLNSDGTYTMFNVHMGNEMHRTLTPSENQKKLIIKNFKEHIGMKNFGMSTKEAQKLINKCTRLKTSEGIVRIINVEYTLAQWVENFTDYLKSAMSYTGKRTLSDFIGNVEVAILSTGEQNAINK